MGVGVSVGVMVGEGIGVARTVHLQSKGVGVTVGVTVVVASVTIVVAKALEVTMNSENKSSARLNTAAIILDAIFDSCGFLSMLAPLSDSSVPSESPCTVFSWHYPGM